MTWLPIAQTLFYASWLIALLVVLILIWRSSEARLKHIQSMEITMFDVASKDAESTRKAVESTQSLVESIHVLVAIVQKERTNDESE